MTLPSVTRSSRTARDTAIKGGDLIGAVGIVDQIADHYEIDRLDTKAECLDKALLQKPAQSELVANRIQITSLAFNLADEAVGIDQIALALRLGKIAIAASQASKDRELIKQASARANQLKAIQIAYQAYSGALEVLAKAPDDPAANEAAGVYLCFGRQQWEQGLPHLAKSQHVPFSSLASQDLAAPETAMERLTLADKWWDAPPAGPAKSRASARERARYWYSLATPELTGLEKARVDKRLAMQEISSAAPIVKAPAIKPTDLLATAKTANRIVRGKWNGEQLVLEEGDAVIPCELPPEANLMMIVRRTSRGNGAFRIKISGLEPISIGFDEIDQGANSVR